MIGDTGNIVVTTGKYFIQNRHTSIAFDDVEIEPSTIKISLSQNFITLLSRQWYFINISNDPIHYAYGRKCLTNGSIVAISDLCHIGRLIGSQPCPGKKLGKNGFIVCRRHFIRHYTYILALILSIICTFKCVIGFQFRIYLIQKSTDGLITAIYSLFRQPTGVFAFIQKVFATCQKQEE